MVSNALSGRYYYGGTPPVCFKAPPGGPIPTAGTVADVLHGYANWTDLDPLNPYQQQAMFPLKRLGPVNVYHGRSSPSAIRLELHVAQYGSTEYWDITLTTYDPGEPPEAFEWLSVWIDPDKPFDTRVLHDINIPGIDYRITRITL